MLSLGDGPLTGTLGKYWGREETRKISFIGHTFQLWLDQWFCLKNGWGGGDLWKLKTFY